MTSPHVPALRRFGQHLGFALALVWLCCLPAHAAKKPVAPDHWVSTWGTASIAQPNTTQMLGQETTLRQIVYASLGGPLVRITLSNQFGTEPLAIGAVHLALAGTADAIQLASANKMTFAGADSIVIPPGAVVLSDPAALAVPDGARLAISIDLPAQTIANLTMHPDARQTSYFAAGNVVGSATLAAAQQLHSWFFLKSVDVKVPGDTGAIVALGDSITDGALSTPDTNSRWPNVLDRRLRHDKQTRGLAIVNMAIGGNRLLHTGTGLSALSRFDVDVLALPGVRYLVLLEGINDIGGSLNGGSDTVTAAQLIQAQTQLIDRAHAHGIKVIGATLTPFVGAGYASPAGEAMRKELNGWIRSNKQLDGMVDFDDVTRDKHDPDRFSPAADSGDHLHPGDGGYKAMGEAFQLKQFVTTP